MFLELCPYVAAPSIIPLKGPALIPDGKEYNVGNLSV